MKLVSPIQAFIFASAGFHAYFILISDSTEITLPGTPGSAISVKLIEQHKQKTQQVIKNTQAKKTRNTVTQTQEKKTSKKEVSQKQEKQLQASSANQENTVSKARVVSLIYKELNNHFTYPKIAQRRNWQGQVLLAFRLSNNGNIENIKISHSSGYNVLDQAAIISLKKIGQLPQASSWLINGMEIQIPIIYQLTQG
ncbi:MAG: energy transducer TonB [Gammaproteobacteria bacterium]|nr:energy transducer TonB [Gammaproteobacteria bacterium]